MLRAFCYLCFQGFLVVAVLVVVLAGLNWGFGWDLGLSIGASDLAIPKEPGEALFLAFALLVIALIFLHTVPTIIFHKFKEFIVSTESSEIH